MVCPPPVEPIPSTLGPEREEDVEEAGACLVANRECHCHCEKVDACWCAEVPSPSYCCDVLIQSPARQ